MGIITSFIPGRVRLRANIFKDEEIASSVINPLKSLKIVKDCKYNAKTGSLLIEYDKDAIPDIDNIKKLLAPYTDEFMKLKFRVLYYTPKDKPIILEAIERANAIIPTLIPEINNECK